VELDWPAAEPRACSLLKGHSIAARCGSTLFVYWASDAFMLAAILGKPVHFEWPCHATGLPIRIEFTPERAERVSPPNAYPMIASSLGRGFLNLCASMGITTSLAILARAVSTLDGFLLAVQPAVSAARIAPRQKNRAGRLAEDHLRGST